MSEVMVDMDSEDKVLATVVNGIKYAFTKDILVKPMPVKMLEKEVVTQVPTKEVDEDGFNKYETVTEVKEVESSYSTGIILSIAEGLETAFKVGDKVVYARRVPAYFDLFKDSMLVKPYDIMAVVKK